LLERGLAIFALRRRALDDPRAGVDERAIASHEHRADRDGERPVALFVDPPHRRRVVAARHRLVARDPRPGPCPGEAADRRGRVERGDHVEHVGSPAKRGLDRREQVMKARERADADGRARVDVVAQRAEGVGEVLPIPAADLANVFGTASDGFAQAALFDPDATRLWGVFLMLIIRGLQALSDEQAPGGAGG